MVCTLLSVGIRKEVPMEYQEIGQDYPEILTRFGED
jgi:hypothetical protein